MSSSSNTQTSCNEDQKSNSNQSPHTIFTDVEKEKLCETTAISQEGDFAKLHPSGFT